MPVFSAPRRDRPGLAFHRTLAGTSAAVVLAVSMLYGVAGVASSTASGPGSLNLPALQPVDHLVISELMTGGASASDEFIEVFNPSAQPLPLEGLELVYVTASGATITRKVAWADADPSVLPGGHLLVANEAGLYGAMADATYAGGLSATGGSVVLRSVGAGSGIDAVGWGTAASSWLEAEPAVPPAAGHSLERLPGGAAGSGQDTDQNSIDFVERAVPDPQGSTSQPTPIGTPGPTVSPGPSASMTPSATIVPTPTVSPSPSPPPGETSLPIGEARALPDGTSVTIEGLTLTDSDFTDGGGYVVDSSGGIAVLLDGTSFSRGVLVRVRGELDDRYHQRTIRATADGLALLGLGDEGDPTFALTGQIGEQQEGTLVRLSGVIIGAPSRLTSSLAFDLDDGSGAVRVVVNDATGIDVGGMLSSASLELVGVVGQRDSSGTGLAGYRVQPRDQQDVLQLGAPTTEPDPSGSAEATASATPSGGSAEDVVTVAAARLAAGGAHVRVRGVVTLPSSVLRDGTAAVEDETGAIVVRLGDEAGELALGELVVVDGIRSTKSGMETIRSSTPPLRLGAEGQPVPVAVSTAGVGENLEARLVRVSGTATAPRRTSAQNVYFDLDDGAGPVRVFVSPATGIDPGEVLAGSWVEVTGVVTQETSGQQPLRGYRIWPRTVEDLRLLPIDDGTSTPYAPDAGSNDTGDTPRPSFAAKPGSAIVPVLPPPRLTARGASAGSPRHSPSPSLDPVAHLSAAASGTTDPRTTTLQVALLAVVLAGAAGSLAAGRAGLVGRIGEVARRLLRPPGEQEAEEILRSPASRSLEAAAGRLVPLRVVDDAPQESEASHAERTR